MGNIQRDSRVNAPAPLINFTEFHAKRYYIRARLSKARREVSDKEAMLECAALLVNYMDSEARLWMVNQLHADNHITDNEVDLLKAFVARIEGVV